jgi:FkbM family methyltransferase
MTNPLRSILVNAAYKAIAAGIRLPRSRRICDFHQWGRLVDILKSLEVNVFLDVGANRGFYSRHLRMSGYSGHILSFEPIIDDYYQLEKFSAADAKWNSFCYALGATTGSRDFQLNLFGTESVLSSFLPLKDRSDRTRIVTVTVKRLDEVLSSLLAGIDNPRIFLKMDTQGFDEEVIEGAKGNLDLIIGIQSEISVVPLYEGMPHYTESLLNYEELGFQLMDLFVVNRTPNDGVLEYDCLMIRKS